ncbi:MAG: hypothetical protein OYG31_01400 [Candidatus Kaiserbacteria bacterium]|nr:hypothetical protein [Candidatus Kaiserbacteria bacterium]
MRNKVTGVVGTCVVIGGILLTYVIAPSVYQAISHQLFSTIYRYHAPPRTTLVHLPGTFPAQAGVLPIRVLARPPQTPYDTLVTTVADIVGNPEGRYVYNERGVPVGRVSKQHRSVYHITLFSSPRSEEIFSVGGFVAPGRGTGSGSFLVQVPSSQYIAVGTPIMHQKTGVVASSVAVAAKKPKEQVQDITGVIASNPLETAEFFLLREESFVPRDRDVDTSVGALKEQVDTQDAP